MQIHYNMIFQEVYLRLVCWHWK